MLAERLTSQLLAGEPARTPEAVVERLLAVQGQDPRGARLAIRARSEGLSAADVDRALNERALLITWLNRGTLHLVRSEDYPWLHALTAPPLAASSARRLAQEGVSPSLAERALEAIERALANDGPLTRVQLCERLAAVGAPTGGQAPLHLLFMASMRGVLVRGPMVGRQHAYVLARDWLPAGLGDGPRDGFVGGPGARERATGKSARGKTAGLPRRARARFDRERALAELARRYLRGHGPASDRDLARWAGLPLRDARAGLAAIAPDLRERADGLLDLARPTRAEVAELPPPRLLGAFDPLLLGWVSREPILAGRAEAIVVRGGMFRPFALAHGRAVGVWTLSANRREVALEPFGRLSRADETALRRDAAAVRAYLAQ